MNSYLYLSLYIGIGLAVDCNCALACRYSVDITEFIHLGNGIVGAYPQLRLVRSCLGVHSYIGYTESTYKEVKLIIGKHYFLDLIWVGDSYLYRSVNIGI